MWGLLAAAALLWPDHLSGPFDGVPLDRTAEAVLVGVIFPALWVFHSRFLATRLARASIVALLVWRACATVLFVQDGWCLRFEPSRPYAKDAEGAPHAWDLRADWRAADPACSAIMTRSYSEFHEFPVWFFNLPPPNDSWPAPEDLPPEATIAMHVRGYLSPSSSGSFDIDVGPGMQTAIAIDGRLSALPVQLAPGVHHVAIDGTLTGTRWRLVPRWNGAELWSNVSATVQRPSIASLRVRSWARWIPLGVTALILSAWIASALARVGHVAVFAWTTGASLIIAWLIVTDQVMSARWAIVALTAAVFVPVPPRLRNLFGAFLLIGVPWMTFVVVCAAPAIGRWVLYEFGNDYWMYQRYAYTVGSRACSISCSAIRALANGTGTARVSSPAVCSAFASRARSPGSAGASWRRPHRSGCSSCRARAISSDGALAKSRRPASSAWPRSARFLAARVN